MPVETDSDGRDDNDGPHCRNCHVGANNCDVCHNDDTSNFSAAYTIAVPGAMGSSSNPSGWKTNYSTQSYIRQSAKVAAVVGDPCLDAGFSFPHRTLGANMLKDELFGIDFNGAVVAAGVARTGNGGTAPSSTDTFSANAFTDDGGWVLWTGENRNSTSIIPTVQNDLKNLATGNAENLDSVCIDCHGDASYWNGDNASYHTTPYAGAAVPYGTYGHGASAGWEMLLKGLP